MGSDLGARELEQWLDIKVVGSHDEFEEFLLWNVNIFSVPLVNYLGHVTMGKGLVDLGWLVVKHMSAEHYDLLEGDFVDLWKWNLLFGAGFFDKSLDKDRLLGGIDSNFDDLSVVALELHLFSHILI